MTAAIKSEIEKCRTGKQVYTVLKKYHIPVKTDDSKDVKCFSIWLDDITRVYKPIHSKTMIVQIWQKVKLQYSGIPVFFG